MSQQFGTARDEEQPSDLPLQKKRSENIADIFKGHIQVHKNG